MGVVPKIMGVIKFAAIWILTVVISLPLMIWGGVSWAEWHLAKKKTTTEVSSVDSPVYSSRSYTRTGETVVVAPVGQPSANQPQKVQVRVRKTKVIRRRARFKGQNGCYRGHKGICYHSFDPGRNPGKSEHIKVMRPDGTYPD